MISHKETKINSRHIHGNVNKKKYLSYPPFIYVSSFLNCAWTELALMYTKDLKYFLAFIPSIGAAFGLYAGGIWTYSAVIIAFVLVPILEAFFKGEGKNFSEDEEVGRRSIRFFDYLLYSNVIVLYGIIGFYFYQITHLSWTLSEIIGAIFSVGIINGTVGINVAHELGHRENAFEQFLAKALLLPNLYMHFTIEHNLGHHKHVATFKDSATSRQDEPLYFFWFRSVVGCFVGSWKLEKKRLNRLEKSAWSISNKVIQYQIIQAGYLLTTGLLFGWAVIPYTIAIAVTGFLLLESVNYIEHYGLQRKQLASGRYEPVTPMHSWNSDHQVGRILLYELTRHADHHYKANRPYQILKHIERSPQLPLGYPGSMLLSLIPPLWFYVMNKKLAEFKKVEV